MIIVAVVSLIVVSFVAGCIPLTEKKKFVNLDYLISFSSGALIAMAFIHMLPLAYESLKDDAGVYALLGFLFLYVLEKFVMVHPCNEDDCHAHHLSISAFVGFSVHCLISGLSVGVALTSTNSNHVAIPIILAFVLHKIPESIVLSSLLAKSKFTKKMNYFIVFAFSLVAPAGVLISSLSLKLIFNSGLNVLLGISTGTFIYIASSDIMPNMHKEDRKRWVHLAILILGVVLLALL